MSAPLSVGDAVTKSAEYLRGKGVDSPRLDAELLLAHVLECDRLKLYLNWERPLSETQKQSMRDLLQRRGQNREPLARIVGQREFYGRSFRVGKGTFVPRPETEWLVERATEALKNFKRKPEDRAADETRRRKREAETAATEAAETAAARAAEEAAAKAAEEAAAAEAEAWATETEEDGNPGKDGSPGIDSADPTDPTDKNPTTHGLTAAASLRAPHSASRNLPAPSAPPRATPSAQPPGSAPAASLRTPHSAFRILSAPRLGPLPDGPRVIDIGTGSGCIAISIALERPDAEVFATDVSEDALSVARDNASALGAAARVRFHRGDLFAGIEGPFDLIVSNPPYIASGAIAGLMPEVATHDPLPALDGGATGLDVYARLAAEAPALLLPGAAILLEIGEGQGRDVAALLKKTGQFTSIRVVKDLAGLERYVEAVRAGERGQA